MSHALIDGDELVLKACLIKVEDHFAESDEESRVPPTLSDAKRTFTSILRDWLDKVDADTYTICLSPDNRHLYRRVLYPAYKAGRSEKPDIFPDLLAWVRKNHDCEDRPGLEADDVMGILSGPACVIVSSDKDMKTVPGRLYMPKQGLHLEISRAEADRHWMTQALTGDTTDNYPGCIGCGPAAASEILAGASTLMGWWPLVVEKFEAPKKGRYRDVVQTRRDAEVQAALARILRPSDYSGDGQIVIPLPTRMFTINAKDSA